MSLHNQDSQHVTNKTSSSLFVNQSTASASSMAKQIAKSTVPSNSNKYSTLNINNQFKGKGIEPQQKTTVMRSAPTGMQTLGKAVAARRMPPPAHLPSLRTFNSSPTQSVESASNETSSGSQTSNSQSGAPTIAAVVSGSPWAHDSNPNSSFEPNTRTFNRNNSINQEDFPKLDETVQQNAAKSKQEGSERAQESVASDEPVLKPANLGNWSSRTPVQSVDEPEVPEPARPAQSQSPANQVYQPSQNRSNNQYRPNKFQPTNHQNFRKYQAESKIDETRRPVLYNKNDSLVETNKENVSDSNKIDFSNLDENNWAMISDRVNYDEKLEFDDDEDMEKKSISVKHNFQVDFEEQQWEDKRKEKQEEVEKNLERAKSRRDEEIKKLNQEMKNVFISDDQSSTKESNQSRENVFKANNSINKQTNRINNQTTNNNNRSNNNSRKNDDHAEHINRPNSRYQGPTNYIHQSHVFTESLQSNDKSEKASHHHQTNSNSQQRQSYSSQSFNQPSFQNQSNRYHQSNANQSNSKAPASNSRYQAKKSDSNQTGEQKTQSEQKKTLKQLSHNVPEIESKLQPLGFRKLPTQTNQNINQAQTEKKIEPDTKTNNSEYQEPKQNVWNRNQNESNQDTQSKQAQSKQEQKNKYPRRSNQSYRNERRRYEEDYDDDYDDYTEEDEEQYSQNNSNRTGSNSGYPRRPNSSQFPQSYKRGSNRRANDFYQMESKNFYPAYSSRSYNYDYNYPKGYSNFNHRGGNSRNSGYTSSNKVFYNSNTKNGGAKEQKEPQNRSRDQTSMTKYSEPTDTEIYDEWETASDTSLRHQVKKIDEPKNSAPKDLPKAKNQPIQKQSHTKKSSNQKDFKSRKTSSNTNPNDPRYTAKYWSDNSKNEKSNEQKQQDNRTKNHNNSNNNNNNAQAQAKNGTNQAKVNLQVYRVDKIVADDPEAIKEALKNQNIKDKSVTKTNPLSGIDLNNRAGVVIVDYIPESGEIATEDNSAEDEEKDDDDGFQKVKTKRDKKAEKLKAQAEAAAAAAARLASANSTKRKEAKNPRKSAPKAEPKTTKVNKSGIMNNIQTWKNDMAKHGAKAITQVVRPATVIAESKTKLLSDDLKKTTTNVWETNANKTEQNVNKVEKCAIENKTIEKDVKSQQLENTMKTTPTTKPKEESSKEINLLKQDAQPSQKNVCTVKPTKQVSQPLTTSEQKPSINVSVNGPGSGVVSPSTNQQLNENQSINKYYDKIMINQSSSAAVAASAAAAAAAVVAVTVTSIQQQQIPSSEQTDQTSAIKQSSSSSSIKNHSGSNASTQAETQNTNNSELSQMTPNQPNYNFAPASTTSQTSLISSPSQTNSQISATSLIHSLSINQSMQPQYLQPIYQPMVQPFMSQSRPMVGPPQPPQSQSANPLIQNQQNKNNLNSLFDLSFGEFGAKEAMFYPPPPPPPHAQNYMGQIPPGSMPPPQTMPPHLPAQPINPYSNGYEHNQFFNQKLLTSKPNGTFVQQPPPMASSQFNGINSSIKSQFNQNTPNQLINQIHQYSKQDFTYFNNQNFGQAQGSNQPTPASNSNNLGFFMSQIGNLNPNQFQAQHSVFNMNQGQLSNNQLFGLGYNQPQQSSQFNLSNLIQTQQNQQQIANQTSAHRQTPLSIPSSPFIQNDNQTENGFIKQQNGFDYKAQQQANQTNYVRNGPNLTASKQMFSSLEANNFDKNQQNKCMSQPNGYYRAMEQQVQNHYNQIGQIPPQQQPPLLPNPPIMTNHNQLPNQMQVQSLNQKIGFNKAAGMPRYPNAYQNQNRPAQNQSAYYNQNNNRRSYPNYQNSGKKMPLIDAKVMQKNVDLSQQSKQDGSQSGQVVQTQTRGSTPNPIEEKNNECNANVI